MAPLGQQIGLDSAAGGPVIIQTSDSCNAIVQVINVAMR